MESLISTNELYDTRVVDDKNGTTRIGKVRSFVFHPTQRRCVGFLVKRPDIAYMFHRKDLFVSIQGYSYTDGMIVVRQDGSATDKKACKALGIDWDACVLWIGLPVITEDGTSIGCVGEVIFDLYTGEVHHIVTSTGATADVLLGKREIPADCICGFRQGVGAELSIYGKDADEAEEVTTGALLVSDEVHKLSAEGGLAKKAGDAAAVASDKVMVTVKKAKPKLSQGANNVGKRVVQTKNAFAEFKEEYNKASGKKNAVKQISVAQAAGNHVKAAGGMFSAFKEEFSLALHEDEPSKPKKD